MRIPTGCNALDRILQGGISSESLTLVYGETETGKTTFAIQCAVSCARQGLKILYVDTDDKFSPIRLSQISGRDYEATARLMILVRPTTFREQSLIIDKLADLVSTGFGLVAIDSITSLYRLRVAESPSKTFDFNRELNRQLAFLAQLARIQKVSVLLTSQVRSVFGEIASEIEPVAPRVLKFWADTIIEMKPTENSHSILAILEKNPTKSPAVACNIKIGGTGIESD
jgi:DNA repair protein RadB